MKKILNLLLIGILMVGLVAVSGCADSTEGATDEGAEELEEVPTYIVGTEPYFPPFEYADENNSNEIIGFDVDLINAIAEDQGFNIEWKDLEFDALIPALQSGQIDMIVSGMTITAEREESVDFSDPYINAGLALAVAADNDEIQDVDDIQGKVAVVQQGSTGAAKADELKEEGLIEEVVYLAHVSDIVMSLQNGRGDFMINDLPVTKSFISQNPDVIKIVDDQMQSESYGFAVKTGNTELLEKLNAGLENVKADGTYDEIMEKYF
ncbi:basic amino acid ABC transporter substrate-binding protein [Methanolobus bombayensis]|uniref:basic amino acid ABC transporter substrate-binding protein n=1 Tax=Methanolobus bombayensis TaxID=38023 RepID=UPI001AEB20DC|nr:basic amino acid ABC transporter substrate-binding protein [Methanolobus bombayensis]MBP1908982.1 polar amino acid transport system substrate-binding protein [Methanolobus bombayensis]